MMLITSLKPCLVRYLILFLEVAIVVSFLISYRMKMSAITYIEWMVNLPVKLPLMVPYLLLVTPPQQKHLFLLSFSCGECMSRAVLFVSNTSLIFLFRICTVSIALYALYQ